MTNLKPCPCCGSRAHIVEIESEGHDFGALYIQCGGNNHCVQTHLRFPCGDDPVPLLAETWNRRAASADAIEGAAGAVFEVMGHDHIESWSDCTSAQKEFYVCIARAALDAAPIAPLPKVAP